METLNKPKKDSFRPSTEGNEQVELAAKPAKVAKPVIAKAVVVKTTAKAEPAAAIKKAAPLVAKAYTTIRLGKR